MNANKFYKAVIEFSSEDENGKVKKFKEEYIVEAVSPTDVEASLHEEYGANNFEFRVKSIQETKIVDIVRKVSKDS